MATRPKRSMARKNYKELSDLQLPIGLSTLEQSITTSHTAKNPTVNFIG